MQALIVAEKLFRGEPFTVMVPASMEQEIQAGCMVLLARKKGAESISIGYIIELAEDNPAEPSETEIIDLLYDGEPLLGEDLLKLTGWMADYYLSRRIDTISAALPAAVRTTIHDMVELTDFSLQAENRRVINTTLRRSIMQLMIREKRLTILQLQRRLGKKQLYRTLSELERGGHLRLTKKFTSTQPKRQTAYRLSETIPEGAEESLPGAPKQLEAFLALSSITDPCVPAETIGSSREILNALVKKGLVEKVQIEVKSNFSSGFAEEPQSVKNPTAEQKHALEALQSALNNKRYATFLLHGVTGSGKTLVYIEFLKSVLAAGKTAIVLVPEISLTPQTAGRFHQHFHDDITILHSGMSNQEKYDAWHNLRQGKTKIALGARSTIFAPLKNLGAIIVDEEHDGAYKQDRTPRYQARDTAIMRALFSKAICVLGSATPSFESYHNARNGKYSLINLRERVDGAAMPLIKLVWMKESPKASSSISELLFRQIELRLEKNEQVILLQNRRGFAGSIFCLSCGHTPLCRFCNIPMVYHAAENHLRCHYCGHRVKFRASCEKCQSTDLFFKSSGTERIEEELKKLFPEEKILRMDVDTTTRKGSHGRILKEFHDQKARILLGTQMVAKGLDFPAVTLVGVLMADIGLNIPDFRASERTFSLLTQVAGRAGRSTTPGEVYLQVYNKESDVFTALLQGSYEKFFEQESATRAALRYPPLSRLIKFECSATDEKEAQSAALYCKETLTAHLPIESGTVLGPAPAGIAKIKGRFRYHVLVKLFEAKLSAAFVREMSDHIISRFRSAALSFIVDVDPQNLM
ncbi:primosomal protein N' [Chlorobium sp. BLA1]|uniref:replication restart helicase PriA n=1 Tax=Candidatus Chlorobium masyuteum TaxID=2716876 RepID=UPI001422A62F|nr:primosomal protein N' [Candidatus Chlorobium masyuteum]NHQ60497.1 primosomal protein N' [Candidatus Chlorobium masyuteum]